MSPFRENTLLELDAEPVVEGRLTIWHWIKHALRIHHTRISKRCVPRASGLERDIVFFASRCNECGHMSGKSFSIYAGAGHSNPWSGDYGMNDIERLVRDFEDPEFDDFID